MKCALIAAISGADTGMHRSSIDLFWRLNCCQSAIFRLQWTRRQTLTFSPYLGEYIFSYIRWNYPKWENFSRLLENAQPGKQIETQQSAFPMLNLTGICFQMLYVASLTGWKQLGAGAKPVSALPLTARAVSHLQDCDPNIHVKLLDFQGGRIFPRGKNLPLSLLSRGGGGRFCKLVILLYTFHHVGWIL